MGFWKTGSHYVTLVGLKLTDSHLHLPGINGKCFYESEFCRASALQSFSSTDSGQREGWLPRFEGLGALVATKGDICLTPEVPHGLWGGIHQDLGPVITPFHIALAQEMQDAGENVSAGTGHTPCNSTSQAPRGIGTLLPGLQHLEEKKETRRRPACRFNT